MNSKVIQSNMLAYEIRNTLGNFFAVFFGIIFPTLMSILFISMFSAQAPGHESKVATQIFIANITLIPLALVFVGFASIFSQEIEQGVTTRINLFGYSIRTVMVSKLIANFLVLTIALIFYTTVLYILFPVQLPSVFGFMTFTITIYLLTAVFFVMAYAIALITRKFGLCYAITMSIYFGTMILSGSMGIPTNMFPSGMQTVANLLPTSYIVNDFPKVWQGSTYNFVSLLQSILFFVAITGILLFIGIRRERRES